jgi:hypothetical protein
VSAAASIATQNPRPVTRSHRLIRLKTKKVSNVMKNKGNSRWVDNDDDDNDDAEDEYTYGRPMFTIHLVFNNATGLYIYKNLSHLNLILCYFKSVRSKQYSISW